MYSTAAGFEHSCVLMQLSSVRIFVDIGANKGQFALVARHCCPEAKIYSFEPLSRPGSIFKKVFGDDDSTILFQTAIGDQSGEKAIHVSAREDSSSLLPITTRQNDLFPGTQEVFTDTIRVGRLNEFLSEDDIQAPAMLKIDVQGYELEALKGSEELLHCFKWVYVECSFLELYQGQALAGEVIGWLLERRFNLESIHNSTTLKDGSIAQADFLFVQQSSLQ